jgi:hypothetical protein
LKIIHYPQSTILYILNLFLFLFTND